MPESSRLVNFGAATQGRELAVRALLAGADCESADGGPQHGRHQLLDRVA